MCMFGRRDVGAGEGGGERRAEMMYAQGGALGQTLRGRGSKPQACMLYAVFSTTRQRST